MYPIVAIVGMCGTGKSIASDYLEEKGYRKVYFGGVTMEVLKEKGLEVTPENEKMIRENLRKEHGMGAYAKILLPRIIEYASKCPTVLDGLYSWDEYKILKDELKENITVIAIVTTKELRYERLAKREVRPLTKEEAEKRDIAEIENLAKGGPIAFADYYISNDGNIDDYKEQLKNIIDEVTRGEKDESKRFIY